MARGARSRCAVLSSLCRRTQVIRVHARKRTSDANFVSCLRLALKDKYGDQVPEQRRCQLRIDAFQPVAIGGVFLIQQGRAKLHVMVWRCAERRGINTRSRTFRRSR